MVVAPPRLRSSRTIRVASLCVVVAFFGVGLLAQIQPPPAPTQYGIMPLTPFGNTASEGYALNPDYGNILAGRARAANGAFHAFLHNENGARDLGTLGGAESAAYSAYFGAVVGQAQIASGQWRAFLYDMNANQMLNLGTLGGTWSAAYATRDGVTVGASRVAGDARLQAFQYANGTMSALPVNLGGDSAAKGLASTAGVVGYSCTTNNAACRPFLFANGAVTMIGAPGGRGVANDINTNATAGDRTEVVGRYAPTASAAMRAFRYADGSITDLGTLGGTTSEALAINRYGVIVGTSRNAAGQPRAFIWRDGVMTNLNTLRPARSGWVLQAATGISDGGQIIGFGTLNGQPRGYLLTPPVDLHIFKGGAKSQADSNLPLGIEVGKRVRWTTSVIGSAPVTIYGLQMVHTVTGPVVFEEAIPRGEGTCQVTATKVTCDMRPFDLIGQGREIELVARTTGPGAISHVATLVGHVLDTNPANNTLTEENRAIALSTFALTPATLPGGKPSAAQLFLTGMAPAGDAIVRVTSSRPDIAAVPANFIVPSWTNQRTFNIIPAVVSAPTTVQITASYGLISLTRTLTVVPPALRQLYLTPTTVIGGCGTSAGRILLTGAAPPSGGVVAMSDTNPKATVPATVTVPAGAESATFTVPTSAVTTNTTGTVTAEFGGVSQTHNFTVRPIRAQSMAFSPNPVKGGATVQGTIALECPAAPGAVTVNFTSSSGLAVPTTTLTMPAGARTATFSVRTSPVSTATSVTISAWVFGVRKTATLTIVP